MSETESDRAYAFFRALLPPRTTHGILPNQSQVAGLVPGRSQPWHSADKGGRQRRSARSDPARRQHSADDRPAGRAGYVSSSMK